MSTGSLSPTTYPTGAITIRCDRCSRAGRYRRETLIEPLDDLRANSVDYYAALRSAYYQDRAVALRKGLPADPSELDTMFESIE